MGYQLVAEQTLDFLYQRTSAFLNLVYPTSSLRGAMELVNAKLSIVPVADSHSRYPGLVACGVEQAPLTPKWHR